MWVGHNCNSNQGQVASCGQICLVICLMRVFQPRFIGSVLVNGRVYLGAAATTRAGLLTSIAPAHRSAVQSVPL